MRDRAAWILTMMLTAGCGSPPPTASPTPAQPSVTAAPVSPAPTTEAVAPQEPAAATPEPLQVAMHPVIEGLENAWVLGDVVLVKYGNSLGLLRDGKFEKRDDLSRQLSLLVMHPLRRVYGRWPDVVFAEMIGTDGRSGWGELYSLQDGKRFVPLAGQKLPMSWHFVGISPWERGSWLSLEVNTMPWGPPPHFRFRRLRGTGGALPAWPATTPTEECPVELEPASMIAFETGEVIVSANKCRGGAAALVWRSGKTEPEVTSFPGSWRQDNWERSIYGTNSKNVVAVWEGKEEHLVVRFDGSNWARVDVPYLQGATFGMGPDGTLWRYNNQTTSLLRDGVWRDVAPVRHGDGSVQILEVIPGSRGDMWALSGSVLLHSERPTGEVVKLEYEQGQERRGTIALPRAADYACEDIFVLMYGMTKVTPKDYDYPLTRKALKGHTEFAGAQFAETEDGGRHYFGAFLQDLDLARKMARIIETKVPNSKPQVLCVKPRIVRRLQVDMATGDVVSNERVDGTTQ